MNPIETLEFARGLTARVFHDADIEQPFSDDDAVRIVVLHRRYIDPSGGDCGRTPDEIATWEADNTENWFTVPLYLYDHSDTIYRPGCSNPWCGKYGCLRPTLGSA